MWGCTLGRRCLKKPKGRKERERKERVQLAASIITKCFRDVREKGVFWEIVTNLLHTVTVTVRRDLPATDRPGALGALNARRSDRTGTTAASK